jgi:sigma-E factor negative regulatory protein RseC
MQQECKARTRFLKAKNPFRFPLAIGQVVKIETPKGILIEQAFAALLPPVLGFMGGGLLTGFLVPASGEPAWAAGGVLGLFILAYLTYLIRKRHPAETTFQVMEIVSSKG